MAKVPSGRLKGFFKKNEIQNLVFISVLSLFLIFMKLFLNIPSFGIFLKSESVLFDIIKEFIANKSYL